MRRLVVALVGMLTLVANGAQGASYLDIFGVVHDPIQSILGGNHAYTGPDLQPGAFLIDADLSNANLSGADLTNATLHNMYLNNADLSGANLFGIHFRNIDMFNANLSGADLTNATLHDMYLNNADLSGANLGGANLSGVDLLFTYLGGANLSGANLSEAFYLGATSGVPNYNALTDFTGASVNGPFDPFVQFDPVAAGWVLVPEPSTALLLGLGLAGLAARRRV